MRDAIVFTAIVALMPACFRRPYVGLLVFSWLAYMRVQDLSWGFVRGMRWSYYIAMLMLAGFIADSKRLRWFIPDVRCWAMLMMVPLLYLGVGFSQTGTFWENKAQINALMEFAKIVGIALFTTAVVTNREQLRVLVWVIALSFAFFGVKSGIWGILTLGRTDIRSGPGGMLADNNDFALALVVSVPLLFHLGMTERKDILRKVFHYSIPLTVITIGLTHSRGGMLSLAGACGVLIWRSKNRVAGVVIALLVVTAVLLAGPAGLRDRLSTLKDVSKDGSANARFRSWAVATDMALDNPWLGVGLDNFRQRYLEYQPNPTPQEQRGEDIYVAHNSYLQIWAETGSLSLLLYLFMLFKTFHSCWRIRRLAKQRYYSSWMINYATAFEASLFGFCIGSSFLNRAHFDLCYHFIAIVVVFEKIAMEELRSGAPKELVQVGRGAGHFVRIDPGGFNRRPRLAGFRDTPLLPERSHA